MNYELAKKLKDAGFPQKPFEIGEHKKIFEGNKFLYEVYIPTLSELIEECGKYFMLFQLADGWGASKSPDGFNHEFTLGIHKSGDTPEEAVANLYLELNKKCSLCDERGYISEYKDGHYYGRSCECGWAIEHPFERK